jgi:hypothetical protein
MKVDNHDIIIITNMRYYAVLLPICGIIKNMRRNSAIRSCLKQVLFPVSI